MIVIHAESTQYLGAQVTAEQDPSQAAVEFGFSQDDDAPAGWTTGSWADNPEQRGSYWVADAKVLVGNSGDYYLAPGASYNVWVRVTALPEVVVEYVGTVKVI